MSLIAKRALSTPWGSSVGIVHIVLVETQNMTLLRLPSRGSPAAAAAPMDPVNPPNLMCYSLRQHSIVKTPGGVDREREIVVTLRIPGARA